MKKPLLLLIISTALLFSLNSCEEENLITGASNNTGSTTTNPSAGSNTGTTTPKCYLKEVVEVEDGEKYTTKLTYNTKNILERMDNDGAITSYEYDGSGRVSKQIIRDGAATETYSYSYDSKGNITTIKYTAKDTPYNIFITEYKITTSSNGQIAKVEAVTEDGNVDFLLEYDAKDNIKKIIISADGKKATLVENVTFDDKSNAFANAGLKKTEIPLVIFGAFFGENLTYFMNTNNVLSDKTLGAFSTEIATTTYKYEYTKDNLPSKKTYIQVDGTDRYEGSATYLYDCK
ncbi:hypothetical protein [Emticicia sp. W12TSBA100-4]|uniref:hypothetical protein n=1 Tax=Emticicia sp. W12TSBA100-4 TaxID=3160965 RepID=UPI0033065623